MISQKIEHLWCGEPISNLEKGDLVKAMNWLIERNATLEKQSIQIPKYRDYPTQAGL